MVLCTGDCEPAGQSLACRSLLGGGQQDILLTRHQTSQPAGAATLHRASCSCKSDLHVHLSRSGHRAVPDLRVLACKGFSTRSSSLCSRTKAFCAVVLLPDNADCRSVCTASLQCFTAVRGQKAHLRVLATKGFSTRSSSLCSRSRAFCAVVARPELPPADSRWMMSCCTPQTVVSSRLPGGQEVLDCVFRGLPQLQQKGEVGTHCSQLARCAAHPATNCSSSLLTCACSFGCFSQALDCVAQRAC